MIALEEENKESKNCLLIDRGSQPNGGRGLNIKQGMVCCDGFVKPIKLWFDVAEKRQAGKGFCKRRVHGQSRNCCGGKSKMERSR